MFKSPADIFTEWNETHKKKTVKKRRYFHGTLRAFVCIYIYYVCMFLDVRRIAPFKRHIEFCLVNTEHMPPVVGRCTDFLKRRFSYTKSDLFYP